MDEQTLAKKRLSTLLASQKFAALSTNYQQESHVCLVAFASTGDMKTLVFTTSKNTRKFLNITHNSRVAMLVDNRLNKESDFSDALAATAFGRASVVPGDEKQILSRLFLKKHPSLSDFLHTPTTALLLIQVTFYTFVSAFQRVVTIRMV